MSHFAHALEGIDTLILCGGLGTRLRTAVPDRPKALAEIAGRPFLDILLSELQAQGLRRFILCTGHGAEQIIARYQGRADAQFAFSTEERPLGTGGAIAHATPLVRSDPFIVVNGDSLCRVSYRALLDFHRERNALLTIVGAPLGERTDVGAMRADDSQRILQFAEKTNRPATAGRRYVSAGIYVMNAAVVPAPSQSTPRSLEFDVFPDLVASARCFVFPADALLIDIGTPERLKAAQDLLR